MNNELTALEKVKAQMREGGAATLKGNQGRPPALNPTQGGENFSEDVLSSPDGGQAFNSDGDEQTPSPDRGDVRDSESPSPLKNEPSHDEPTNEVVVKSKCKTPSIDEDMLLVADNTHEIVMEKLENYKAELAALDKKKQKEIDAEKGKEEDEDDGEKKKKLPPKLILCTNQTKYRVIKKACRKLDYKLNDDENADWDLYWADTGIQPLRI